MSKRKEVTITLRVDAEILNSLDMAAEYNNLSRSDVVRLILEDFADKDYYHLLADVYDLKSNPAVL